MTNVTTVRTFAATPWECGPISLKYQVTYTPESSTENLINLPIPTVASIDFTQSINIDDAQQYTVTVKAFLAESTDESTPLATETATYTYIFDCLSTSISTFPNAVESMVAFAGYISKSSNKYTFNDFVSLSKN